MEEGSELQGLVGYQMQRANVRFLTDAHRRLARFDISPARFSALLLIRDNPGCTQSALGDALDVNRSSAMKIINYLEERELVTREAASDSRANALHLTAKGDELIPRILAELKAHEDTMMRQLTDRERATFLKLLAKLRG